MLYFLRYTSYWTPLAERKNDIQPNTHLIIVTLHKKLVFLVEHLHFYCASYTPSSLNNDNIPHALQAFTIFVTIASDKSNGTANKINYILVKTPIKNRVSESFYSTKRCEWNIKKKENILSSRNYLIDINGDVWVWRCSMRIENFALKYSHKIILISISSTKKYSPPPVTVIKLYIRCWLYILY